MSTNKTLIIAEKPSVAGDIARALGGMKRGKDCYEGERYIVSSAIGHLLEIVAPEGEEVKRGKWSLVNLPVLPSRFDLRPIKASESRLHLLTKLYKRKDVGDIVNACDAGREGELIFHNLIRYVAENQKGKPKQVRRLWLQSMTPAAIRQGFEKLRDGDELQNLRQAAVCRSEADWLVGINSTRAMTALHSAKGGFFLTTVGRVQTPTLAIITEREQEIQNFESKPYWEIRASFAAAAGEYDGLWHDLKEKQRPERIFSHARAEEVLAACGKGGDGIVSEVVKPASESPPGLFDLTSLQREANSRFGMSAKMTLATAQALYERHKLITYPRTDSRALPEDYPATVMKTLSSLAGMADIGVHAKKIMDEKWVRGGNKRIFNNAKVSDHFAIIPTGEHAGASLRDNERKMYELICRRFLAAFFPPAKFLTTERKTVVDDHCFVTKGRVLKEPGWRAVAGQTAKDSNLVPVTDKERVKIAEIEMMEKATQPPPRYNEATLLSVMEGAGKRVEEEELREAMTERGLGTPATRASIIEGLLRERYLVRNGRELIPTPKAHSLMRLLAALKADMLTRPALTGEWEYKLRQIEKAEFTSAVFMDDIRKMTSSIVEAAKTCGDVEKIEGDFAELKTPCPSCGGAVRESHRRFSCSACEFFLWKAMGGRELSVTETEKLLKDGETGELEGFRSRMGREFAANIMLKKEGDDAPLRAVFAFDQQNEDDTDIAELAEKEAVGGCPKCGGVVRDLGARYRCEKAVGEAATCDFTLSRRILQRELEPEQVRLLLEKGKTAMLDNFISKKNRRPFKARLVMNLQEKDGKLAFEFAPRAAAKK